MTTEQIIVCVIVVPLLIAVLLGAAFLAVVYDTRDMD